LHAPASHTQVKVSAAGLQLTSLSAQCFARLAWTQWWGWVAGQQVLLQQSSSLAQAGPGPLGAASSGGAEPAVSGRSNPPVSETFGLAEDADPTGGALAGPEVEVDAAGAVAGPG
jgi:hypothetical protein